MESEVEKPLNDNPAVEAAATSTPLTPLVQTFTTPLHRRKGRLQRSERLQTVDSSTSSQNSTTTPPSYSAWEALVKESFGQIAWPIKITSWELVDERVKLVPNRIMSKWSMLRQELQEKRRNVRAVGVSTAPSSPKRQPSTLTKIGESFEKLPQSFRRKRNTATTSDPALNIIGRRYLNSYAERPQPQPPPPLATLPPDGTKSPSPRNGRGIGCPAERVSSRVAAVVAVATVASVDLLQQRRRRFGLKTKAIWRCDDLDEQLSGGRSSSATELISRRGVFSRHHYGSVDQLPQTDLDGIDPNFKRFRVENGDSLAEKDEVFGSPSTPILENPEHQTRWYFKYFLGKLHQNYVGLDAEKNPYFLSVVSQDSGNQGAPMYRAILFRKQGAQKIALPYQASQKLTVKQILTHFAGIDAAFTKNPKEIFAADIQKDLLLLEEQEGSVNFKFGVVYMRPGQSCDDEMLSNEEPSQDFEDFLDVLGERVRLKGWDRFRGGLDVKGDMTGKYSVYTLYEGHEIMFHVSTLLPFSRDNRQQVERKRHIGNDIVNIVFIDQTPHEGEAPGGSPVLPTMFDPTWIKSQFTHIFAVVTKIDQTFRLALFCDENVPPFGPTLPNPPQFTDIGMFREFLLVKLINAEKATFQTPTFAQKRERTLEMLIKDLHEDYVSDSKLNMLNRRAFSEVLYDVPRTSKLKEDARQIEFVRIGQALKLEAIVRGDAPTSIASASPCTIFKKPPWEPHCFYPTFPHRGALCGDSCGGGNGSDECLFMATDDGTFLMKEDQSHQLVFDKTFQVRQLSVLEEHGLLLIRGGSLTNRDAHRLHVFRLREFQSSSSDDGPQLRCRNRGEVKDRRIERTRGCHLYASSRINGGHLRLVVAVGRKLQLFQWKHTAAWASWCPESDTETAEGFIFQKEIQLGESPSILTPLEGPTNTNAGGLICVGYRYHYEIVCDQSGSATRLHEVEPAKRNQTQLTAAIELCDGLETELLLCYNHTCHFQKLNDKDASSSEFDFHWNTSPTSVVCAFPYILGFTADSIEIRLLVNGNLVHTAIMPELQMITSKRDIFFVTTAPEFISKELQIKGLQINELTPERRLVNTPSETSSNEEEATADLLQTSSLALATRELLLNPEHELPNLLEIPSAAGHLPPMQRARSLQKTHAVSDEKPVIAKSNSCGDSYNAAAKSLRSGSVVDAQATQPGVPPNSPRSNGSGSGGSSHNGAGRGQSPMSPTKRSSSKYRNLFNAATGNVGSSGGGGVAVDQCSSSPDRLKPLRVYRIPLAKLTGTHSHFHMHSFNASSAAAHSAGHHQQQQQHLQPPLALTKKQQSMDVQFPLCQPGAVLQE